MALNPTFESQSTRCLPLAYGYVLGSGDKVLSTVLAGTTSQTQTEAHILYEGEGDGFEMLSLYGGSMKGRLISDTADNQFYTVGAGPLIHYHSGRYTPKGLGVTNTPSSIGPDQQADLWFPHFPSVTPPQSFSNMAYAMFNQSIPYTTGVGAAISLIPFAVSGIWRGARCRTFDANGNVLTYQFTLNPAWHFVDAILRYQIKPQQPYLAGLTAAEKACFNWPSIVATAARNDFILPNGNPRFFGSYIFASNATLTNILETILRCSRSYQFRRNGQIHLCGYDARNPVFYMGGKHLVPGSLKLQKKDISKSPNVFVPKYRDIEPPAVCTVANVAPGNPSNDPPNTMVFTTSTPSPFFAGDVVVYANGSNAAANGDYAVSEPSNNDSGNSGTVGLSYIPNKVYVKGPSTGAISSTGGVLGTNNARFSQRAPTNVQHRSHQKIIAGQAPGLAVQPRVVPVYYDCGNSTFDQTNRLMKFERDSQLGSDIGAGWTAPISGTLSVFLEAIDSNGNLFSNINPRDVIYIDNWVSPEFGGEYMVMDPITINPPTGTSVGTIDIAVLQYNPNAFTDVSDDPGQSYASVPSPKLPLSGFTQVGNPAWVLSMTPSYSGSGSSLSVTIPTLVLHLMGQVSPTTYLNVTWTGLTSGSQYVLYLDDPAGTGASFTTGNQPGALPLTSPPLGRYVVLAGVIAAPAGNLG